MKSTIITDGRYAYGPFLLIKKKDKLWVATVDGIPWYEETKAKLIQHIETNSEEMKKWRAQQLEHGPCHICEEPNAGYRYSSTGVFQCDECRRVRNRH